MTMHDNVLTYREVLELSERAQPRSLLLGNGFSIAQFPQIFSYDRLYEAARGNMREELRRLFDSLGTRDFERVMELLRSGEVVNRIYFQNLESSEQLQKDRADLREMLVATIANSHPDSRNAIQDQAYQRCWTFLSSYSNLFTTNYDLLLYWVLMWKYERTPVADLRAGRFPFKDAFFVREDDRLYWARMSGQAVFYLHGAVHIIRHGHRVHKLNLTDDKRALITQVNAAIDAETYPLFVSEASPEEKLVQIKRDSYLDYCYQQIRSLRGELVIFGSSISPVDDHIWEAVQVSSVTTIYVGTRAARGTDAHTALRQRLEAHLIEPRRRRGAPIEMYVFDANTASVWR